MGGVVFDPPLVTVAVKVSRIPFVGRFELATSEVNVAFGDEV